MFGSLDEYRYHLDGNHTRHWVTATPVGYAQEATRLVNPVYSGHTRPTESVHYDFRNSSGYGAPSAHRRQETTPRSGTGVANTYGGTTPRMGVASTESSPRPVRPHAETEAPAHHHHQQYEPRRDFHLVSTPPASRNETRTKPTTTTTAAVTTAAILSPPREEEIIDRLAGFWANYVGRGEGVTDAQQQAKMQQQQYFTTAGTPTSTRLTPPVVPPLELPPTQRQTHYDANTSHYDAPPSGNAMLQPAYGSYLSTSRMPYVSGPTTSTLLVADRNDRRGGVNGDYALALSSLPSTVGTTTKRWVHRHISTPHVTSRSQSASHGPPSTPGLLGTTRNPYHDSASGLLGLPVGGSRNPISYHEARPGSDHAFTIGSSMATYHEQHNHPPTNVDTTALSLPHRAAPSYNHFYGSPHRARSQSPFFTALKEGLLQLEERERQQREHVRFLEAQLRRGIFTREDIERPMTASLTVTAAAKTEGGRGGGMPLIPWSWSSGLHSVDIASSESKSSSSSSAAVAHNFSLERRNLFSQDETRLRSEIEAAEAEFRAVITDVIQGLQRHANRTAVHEGVRRALLILQSDEQQDRKQLVGLEAHMYQATVQLYNDSTKSLVSNLYERVKLFSSSSNVLQREESKRRLDVIDDEIVGRRQLLVAVHEAELLFAQRQAKRLADCTREMQRIVNEESELRFALVQEEDQIRSDRFARWAHEKTILDHLERTRLTTARSLYAKLVQLAELECASRQEVVDMESRLRSSLLSYYGGLTLRHQQLLRHVYEREWKESQHKEHVQQIQELTSREQDVRNELLMGWGCVITALEEWSEEMKLQRELELRYFRIRELQQRMDHLEDEEANARRALVFTQDAVHSQHVAWVREVHAQVHQAALHQYHRRVAIVMEGGETGRQMIAEEEQQRRENLWQQCVAERQVAKRLAVLRVEKEQRDETEFLLLRALRTVLEGEIAERRSLMEREYHRGRLLEQQSSILESYAQSESDSRHELTQIERTQREGLMHACTAEKEWLERQVAAHLAAVRQLLHDISTFEAAARTDIHQDEQSAFIAMELQEDKDRRRVHEAVRLAQREKEAQFRTAAMTLMRLEEVNRDVIYGAAARDVQSLEQRLWELHRRFAEEHKRALMALEDRKRRTLDEKRRAIMDDEALVRCELEDTEKDMRDNHLLRQFFLRRPLAESDTPTVAALLSAEVKARTDLEDMFTYERWNLADLYEMAKDDIEDEVAGRRGPSAPRTGAVQALPALARDASLPQTAEVRLTPNTLLFPTDSAEFAQTLRRPHPVSPAPHIPPELDPAEEEDTFVLAAGEAQRLLNLPLPQKPPQHAAVAFATMRQAWSSLPQKANNPEEGTSSSWAVLGDGGDAMVASTYGNSSSPHLPDVANAATSTLIRQPSLPPSSVPPPPPSRLPSRALARQESLSSANHDANAITHAPLAVPMLDWKQQEDDLVLQESERRKKLMQFQYQMLAQIIQHNIDTLPE